MRKEEVIFSFCAISTQVGNQVFKNDKAHDCFCSDASTLHPNSFNFEKEVLEFIENAVDVAIQKKKIEILRKRKDANILSLRDALSTLLGNVRANTSYERGHLEDSIEDAQQVLKDT